MKVPSDNSLAISSAAADNASAAGGAWPPGFRFHPTDEELILYYLKRKICKRRIKLDVIRETDVYKWDPEELPGQSILKTGDRQWFFFSPRDRKYPNGARSNRATRHGYWKATGKDRNITCNNRAVGVKKTLVFYRGRAPNGARTDWVMHEYTLDEEELNRCQNVQDYYALYKVYKKSGPGPKNGEQYGAPFKEEEWVEDDYVDVFQYLDQGVAAAKEPKEVTSSDNSRVNCDIQSSLDDLEEFMNRLADEPELGEQQVAGVLTLPRVVEEETQSTLVEPLSREVVFHPSVKQCNVPASFDVTQSSTSQLQLQLYEAPEVTSAPDKFKHKVNSSEDFLEIDDLLGPEPTIPNLAENSPFEEMDGLSEFDLYHDASLFFHELGPVDQGVTHSNVNTLGNDGQLNYHLPPNDMVNQLNYQFQTDDMMVNQLNFQLQPNDMLNQFNYQIESDDLLNQFVSDQTSCQLWMHDQRSEIAAELNQGGHSLPTSGVVHESTDLPMKPNPGPNGEQSVGTTSRFSSALWSLVESIPTTPASAAENALVSRAFERMSSFSRVRLNARNTNLVDSNRVAVTKRASRNKGFVFFSVLGAVCAILWMLVGTMRLWGRCISS